MSGILPPVAQYDTTFTLAAGQFSPLRVDSTGALVVTGGGGGGMVVIGSETPSDAFANPTDAVGSWSLLGAWDGTQWVRPRAGQLGTLSAATAGLILNVLPTGRYTNATITLSDGEARILQLTANAWLRIAEQQAPTAEDNTNGVYANALKPLATNTYAPSLFTNFATDADVSIKATPGNVFSACVHNLNASARYFQIFNKASAPTGGDTPLLTFLVPGSSMLIVGSDLLGPNGTYFSTGIASGFSTTEATYTAGTASDQYTQVWYK